MSDDEPIVFGTFGEQYDVTGEVVSVGELKPFVEWEDKMRLDRDAKGRFVRDDAVIANALRQLCDCVHILAQIAADPAMDAATRINRTDIVTSLVVSVRSSFPAIDPSADDREGRDRTGNEDGPIAQEDL